MKPGTMLRTTFAVALLALAADAAADGGRVVDANGAILLRKGAVNQVMRAGAVIQPGDTIATDVNGSVDWGMDDNSVFTLGPSSEFNIDTYEAPPKDSGGRGRALLRLAKGAFRTISGWIGKGAGDEYRVSTSTVTMGIRGTSYAAAVCKGCVDADGKALPDGVYVEVYDGTVSVANKAGNTDATAGKILYVATGNTPGVFVPKGPVIFQQLAQRQVQFNFSPELDRDIQKQEAPEVPVSPS